MELTKYVSEKPPSRDIVRYLDAEIRKIQRALDSIASWKDNEIRYEAGTWTPVVRGTGTAGTYELSSHNCRYTRIFNRVFIEADVRLAAVITGGGTGNLQITGLPYASAAPAFGVVRFDGVNFGASRFAISLASGTNLFFNTVIDNTLSSDVQIAGVAATDIIFATIGYETSDP